MPIRNAVWLRKSSEYGTWGGEIRPGFEPNAGDIVATGGVDIRIL